MSVQPCNVAVVSGVLSSDTQLRELASGDVLASYEITVREGDDTSSVPVAWFGTAAKAIVLAKGEEVVAVGKVRRRFFTAGERTQSRTELVADTVLPARRQKAVTSCIERVIDVLELTV